MSGDKELMVLTPWTWGNKVDQGAGDRDSKRRLFGWISPCPFGCGAPSFTALAQSRTRAWALFQSVLATLRQRGAAHSLRLGAVVAWLPDPRAVRRGGRWRQRGAAPPAAGVEAVGTVRRGPSPGKGARSRLGPASVLAHARPAWGPSPDLCWRRHLSSETSRSAAAAH